MQIGEFPFTKIDDSPFGEILRPYAIVYLYKNLQIKIGQWQEKVPVGFLERDDIPPLLGRLKCMEILKVTFENRITTLEKNNTN